MARPARKALVVSTPPSAARPRGLPRHALRRSAAALFVTTLVALSFAVMYRAAVSRSLGADWRWDSLSSFAAFEEEEDGAQGDDDLVRTLPSTFG